ncbi:MAG: hypothetical protein ACYDIE_10345 [Candidatus Krumholzibacteriia bacterium]
MRKLLPVVVLALVTGLASPLLAGPSIFAGVSVPTGDFADGWKVGLHGGAQYLYPVTPLGAIGIRGAYNRFSPDSVLGVTPDGHLNMLELLAVGQLSLVAGPHFLAGVGLTRSDATVGAIDFDAQTDFTAVAGLGMSFAMLDVTALYHNVATDVNSTSYITVSAGLGF